MAEPDFDLGEPDPGREAFDRGRARYTVKGGEPYPWNYLPTNTPGGWRLARWRWVYNGAGDLDDDYEPMVEDSPTFETEAEARRYIADHY